MTLQEIIESYYDEKKYNCSETIIRAANDYYGLGLDEDNMKMMSGFGSGMYVGKTCGALVGCVAAVSKAKIQTKAKDDLQTFRPQIQLLVRHFKAELGDTECAQVKPHSYTPELHCLNTVQAAGRALEKTMEEIGVNPAQ